MEYASPSVQALAFLSQQLRVTRQFMYIYLHANSLERVRVVGLHLLYVTVILSLPQTGRGQGGSLFGQTSGPSGHDDKQLKVQSTGAHFAELA